MGCNPSNEDQTKIKGNRYVSKTDDGKCVKSSFNLP